MVRTSCSGALQTSAALSANHPLAARALHGFEKVADGD
jgi:hypothetical protein